jgi:hypothetical protein
MSHAPSPAAQNYSPLYFLASLGAGGLTVTFFMYLMFWVPHPGQTVPVFKDIARAFAAGGPLTQGMIALAMAGIAVFSVLNIKALVWNLRQYAAFRRTDAYTALRSSNAETQILAMPLALAMSVNVGFILGLVFVPGLWSVVEYLFPLAMIAFLAIGWLAFRMIGDFLGRVLTSGGGFSHKANNSYAQLLPAFALAMIGVGLAAPAALSTSATIAGLGVITSTFFMVAAVVYGTVALILGVHAMMEHGAAPEAAPTLMVVIPMLTVLGILSLRQSHGLGVHFGVHAAPGETLGFLGLMLSVQVLFGLLGLVVLRRQNYAATYMTGERLSAGSYALVCPGVALSVMLHFFLNKGLVAAGLVDKFSATYWAVSALAIAFQVAMIVLVVFLNRRHFGRPQEIVAVPAE